MAPGLQDAPASLEGVFSSQGAGAHQHPLKLLVVIDTLGVGGTERSLLEILRRFEHTQVVVCQLYAGDALLHDYQQAGLRVIPVNVTARLGIAAGVRKLRKVIRQERPDLLHAALFRAGLISRIAGRLEKLPVVDSLVGDPQVQHGSLAVTRLGRAKLATVRLVNRLTAPWVAQFMANSQSIADISAEQLRLNRQRISVIHRCRDPQRFSPFTPPACLLNARQQPLTRPIFLNVGRLREWKGLPELITAFHTVQAQLPTAQLVLAGDGPVRVQLDAQIRQLNLQDHVHLLGEREDIPALLAAADVLVFPTHSEGHSGALIEAMLAQKPIVATDIPANAESVTHGQSALLVPVNNSAALATAMLQLANDPPRAHRLASRARSAAVHRFSPERIAAQHEALYQDVVHSSPRQRGQHQGSP